MPHISRLMLRGRLLWGLLAISGLLVSLLVIPLGVIVACAIHSGGALTDMSARQAMTLSLLTSSCTTLITFLVGTPLAYLQARRMFPFGTWVETLVDLPIVLPPSVAGIALLMTFGRQGLFGPFFEAVGWQVAFTTLAVVIAQLFVSAPLYVRAARVGFASVDVTLEEAALTEGAGEWTLLSKIMLPLSLRAIVGGLVLSWTRSLGEFGATLMFAGNLEGRTQTMPLSIYLGLERDLDVALGLSAFLVLTSLVVLRLMSLLERPD